MLTQQVSASTSPSLLSYSFDSHFHFSIFLPSLSLSASFLILYTVLLSLSYSNPLMDSWSYDRSFLMANETPLRPLPFDSFAGNREFEPRLANDDVFMAGNSNGISSVPSNLLHQEDEEDDNQSSSSKFSDHESSRTDFKLSSFVDLDDDTSSRAFALQAKKPRASNSCSQKPLCQVYGCYMDLTSSKDYHKRHRVCEAHSKTSVVIVNGLEQRFCQQCSRFHFLSEFDNGKRSCRRRLAGHNERRRKPSFYFLPGNSHKLLRTSQGNKILENSSVLPEAFPGRLLYRVMDEHDTSRLMSFKDEPTCSIYPAIRQNNSTSSESKPAIYLLGVSSLWDLNEAAPSRSTCAHSLLSAQSQQQHHEIPNTSFSITQPNRKPNHMHQREPLWMDPGKGSSTVDLLQLSSHLQRIEQQRNFTGDVKQEYSELYFHGP